MTANKKRSHKFMSILSVQSKNHFKSFMNSPVGVYVVQDDRFLISNAKFQEITGYSEKELKETNPRDFVFHKDRELVHENAIQMLEGKQKEPYPFRVQNKSGNILWVMETVTPITYQGKQAMLGILMDITTIEEFRASFMNSPIGIYIIQDSKFHFSNEKFQEITGFSEKALHAKQPHELVYPDDREQVRKDAQQMLKGQRKKPYHFRILNKKGEIKWIIETVASIHLNGKRAVLGNFMDITRIKHVEEAMLETEKKYASLFMLAREGIAIVRYEDGQILDTNLEMQKMTGYPPEVLHKKKIWEIQPYEFHAEAKNSFQRFREEGGGIVSWRLCQPSNGKLIPVEIAAQKIQMGKEEVILCMFRDTSERESMMRALSHATEEWRKSFDAIDDAVMLIDPDFKVLRANIAAGKLIGRDVRRIIGCQCYKLIHGTKQPPDYCPHVKAQAKGAFNDTEVEEPHLNRILHFSTSPIKDEDGHVSHCVEIISDVTDQRRDEQESIRLSNTLAKSFKGITESLSDLAESRDPYTAGHSKHVAELSLLAGKELGYDDEALQGLRVCALLHDIGKVIIPAAILNKPGVLSEHEWGLIKAHPRTAYESLLHIPFPWPVAEVVLQHHERMDGSGYPQGLRGEEIHPWARIIGVADMIDAITSHRPYRPKLPRKSAMDELIHTNIHKYDQQIVETLIRILQLDDKRILVIDNHKELIENLVAVLSVEGLEIQGTIDPVAAIEMFKDRPFPLIIAELHIHQMEGTEVIRTIKQISPTTEVIATTAFGEKEDALKAIRAGATDYIEKPFDLELLKKCINRALQRYSGRTDITFHKIRKN